MDSIDWNSLSEKAVAQTNQEFSEELANLTNLKADEINNFIAQSKISNENAVKVLKEINNSILDNNQKATAIKNIENGVEFIINIVSKIV